MREWLHRTFDPSQKLVLCGDFNVAPKDCDINRPETRANKITCSPEERAALVELTEWGFHDSFRLFPQLPESYSYWDYRGGGIHLNLGWRLDHIYLSSPLVPFCSTAWIDSQPRRWTKPSDHAPVCVRLEIPPTPHPQ